MPKAYVIGHVTLTNAETFMADYGAKVEDTITEFGGKFLVRGGEVAYQEGDLIGELNVIDGYP